MKDKKYRRKLIINRVLIIGIPAAILIAAAIVVICIVSSCASRGGATETVETVSSETVSSQESSSESQGENSSEKTDEGSETSENTDSSEASGDSSKGETDNSSEASSDTDSSNTGGYNPVDQQIIQDVNDGKYKGMVAFTFDDGPNYATTPKLLNALEREGIPVTFFMIGQNVPGNEEIVKKMVDIGCEIGSHSWDHTDLSTLSKKGIQDEIDKAKDAIRNACGYNPSVFRAPYGSLPKSLQKQLDVPSVYWNVDTLDWKKMDANYLKNYLIKNVSDGDIVLMHDIHETSVNGFISAIKELKKKGYAIVTVSTLLNRDGVAPTPGVTYFDGVSTKDN